MTVLLLVGSVVLNGVLAVAVLAKKRADPVAVSVSSTAVRDVVKTIDARTPSGDATTVEFPSALPTLLYVMSPDCIWCRRNEDNFATILRSQTDRYRIVVASLTDRGFEDYLTQHQSSWIGTAVTPVVIANSQAPGGLRVSGTPSLIVLSTKGEVTKLWSGAFTDSRAEVEAFFGTTLPGVRQ